MGEEQLDASQRHFQLPQPDGAAAAAIKNQFLAACFDERAGAKPVGQGSGQGLAICHAVVERHGGSITFETEMGVGTTFVVRLPLETPDAPPVEVLS